MRAVRADDLRTRTKEILDLAASGETIIVSRAQNRNAVVLSETEYNSLLGAIQFSSYYDYINSELDKAVAREGDPSTQWYSTAQARLMLGL